MARKRRKRGSPHSKLTHPAPVILSYAPKKKISKRKRVGPIIGAVVGTTIAAGTPELITRQALRLNEHIVDRQIKQIVRGSRGEINIGNIHFGVSAGAHKKLDKVIGAYRRRQRQIRIAQKYGRPLSVPLGIAGGYAGWRIMGGKPIRRRKKPNPRRPK